MLLFGLDETQDFKVVGVYDLQALQKKVTEQCNQMEPPVRAVFTIAEAEGLPFALPRYLPLTFPSVLAITKALVV